MSKQINQTIISLIEDRMKIGAKKYGEVIYVDDKRDFLQEGLEEALDMSVYLAGKLIQLKNMEEKMTTPEEHINDNLYEQHREDLSNAYDSAIQELVETVDLPEDRLVNLFVTYVDNIKTI